MCVLTGCSTGSAREFTPADEQAVRSGGDEYVHPNRLIADRQCEGCELDARPGTLNKFNVPQREQQELKWEAPRAITCGRRQVVSHRDLNDRSLP